MTTSPAVRVLLIGCAFAALGAYAHVARTTPSAHAGPLTAVRQGGSPPLITATPGDTSPLIAFRVCAHDISSMLTCASAAEATGLGSGLGSPTVDVQERALTTNDMKSATLIIHTTGGKTLRYVFNRKIDAVFINEYALDRFAMPYYLYRLGFDSAAALRTRIQRMPRK